MRNKEIFEGDLIKFIGNPKDYPTVKTEKVKPTFWDYVLNILTFGGYLPKYVSNFYSSPLIRDGIYRVDDVWREDGEYTIIVNKEDKDLDRRYKDIKTKDAELYTCGDLKLCDMMRAADGEKDGDYVRFRLRDYTNTRFEDPVLVIKGLFSAIYSEYTPYCEPGTDVDGDIKDRWMTYYEISEASYLRDETLDEMLALSDEKYSEVMFYDQKRFGSPKDGRALYQIEFGDFGDGVVIYIKNVCNERDSEYLTEQVKKLTVEEISNTFL